MTDLEMTRLCAEAMGYKIYQENSDYVHCKETGYYDPLRQDAYAMALVKRFKFGISYVDYWSVYEQGNGESGHNSDLNRAIVECMAKMQSTKP